METNSSPLILMEGVLEKLKGREFPWIFLAKKLSAVWVVRYYVLRYADILGQNSFLLEQHENYMPFSKVHKTLDLRRVLQIDTNISLKVGNQDWILAIHYKAKHSEKLKVLYLAADSETTMNIWVMKLNYACKLQKQDNQNRQLFSVTTEDTVDENSNKFPLVAGCLNSRNFIDSSVVEAPNLSNIITSDGKYVDAVTAHAYIHLKDCSSTHSLGGSSASISSSCASLSISSENVAFRNSSSTPPPIPAKPSHGSNKPRRGRRIFDSDNHQILSIEPEDWNDETIHIDAVDSISTDRNCLSFNSSLTSTVSDSSAPKPLPRRRNFCTIPPKVDRSCKPTGIKYNTINSGQEKSNIDDWENEAFAASPQFLSTNVSHQLLHFVSLRNERLKIPVNQEALYDNHSIKTNVTLDYLDPVREPLAQSHPFDKFLQRTKISCATEYTQIDEESTKAVLKANVRQNEMRRNGFPV